MNLFTVDWLIKWQKLPVIAFFSKNYPQVGNGRKQFYPIGIAYLSELINLTNFVGYTSTVSRERVNLKITLLPVFQDFSKRGGLDYIYPEIKYLQECWNSIFRCFAGCKQTLPKELMLIQRIDAKSKESMLNPKNWCLPYCTEASIHSQMGYYDIYTSISWLQITWSHQSISLSSL